jgi:hypothetical protein
MNAGACHPSYMRNINRRILIQANLVKTQAPVPKVTKAKRTRGVAQVAEHLLGQS